MQLPSEIIKQYPYSVSGSDFSKIVPMVERAEREIINAQWKEWLPKEEGEYIVCTIHWAVCMADFDGKIFFLWSGLEKSEVMGVNYWMRKPLPKR